MRDLCRYSAQYLRPILDIMFGTSVQIINYKSNLLFQFPLSEVQSLRDQLQDIQSAMVDGNFLAEDTTMPAGQQVARELLNRCLKWSEIVISRYGKISLINRLHTY